MTNPIKAQQDLLLALQLDVADKIKRFRAEIAKQVPILKDLRDRYGQATRIESQFSHSNHAYNVFQGSCWQNGGGCCDVYRDVTVENWFERNKFHRPFDALKASFDLADYDLDKSITHFSENSIFDKLQKLESELQAILKTPLDQIHFQDGKLVVALAGVLERYQIVVESMIAKGTPIFASSIDPRALIKQGQSIIAEFNKIKINVEKDDGDQKSDIKPLADLFVSAVTLKLGDVKLESKFVKGLLKAKATADINSNLQALRVVNVEASVSDMADLLKLLQTGTKQQQKVEIFIKGNKVAINSDVASDSKYDNSANLLEISETIKTTEEIAELLQLLPSRAKCVTFNNAYVDQIALTDPEVTALTINGSYMLPTMVQRDLFKTFQNLNKLQSLHFNSISFAPKQKRPDFFEKVLAQQSESLLQLSFSFVENSNFSAEEKALWVAFIKGQPNLQSFVVNSVDWVRLEKDKVEIDTFLADEQKVSSSIDGVLAKQTELFKLNEKYKVLIAHAFPELDAKLEKQWPEKAKKLFAEWVDVAKQVNDYTDLIVCYQNMKQLIAHYGDSVQQADFLEVLGKQAIRLIQAMAQKGYDLKHCKHAYDEFISKIKDAQTKKEYVLAICGSLIPELTEKGLAYTAEKNLDRQVYGIALKACLEASAKHCASITDPAQAAKVLENALNWIEMYILESKDELSIKNCAEAFNVIQDWYMKLLTTVMCQTTIVAVTEEVFTEASKTLKKIEALKSGEQTKAIAQYVNRKQFDLLRSKYEYKLVQLYQTKILEIIASVKTQGDVSKVQSGKGLGTRLSALVSGLNTVPLTINHLQGLLKVCLTKLAEASIKKKKERKCLIDKLTPLRNEIEKYMTVFFATDVHSFTAENIQYVAEVEADIEDGFYRVTITEQAEEKHAPVKSKVDANTKVAVGVLTSSSGPSLLPPPSMGVHKSNSDNSYGLFPLSSASSSNAQRPKQQ